MFHVLKRIRNLRRLTSSQADVAFFCWIQKITAERFGAFVRKYYFCTRNTGCSSVRLEYASGGRVVAGSNPVIPTAYLLRFCVGFSAWKRFFFCLLVRFVVVLTKFWIKLKHSRWRFARFRSETSVSEIKVADFLKALIISNSKFVRTGSELIWTSSELICISSELNRTTSELISRISE